MPAIGARSVDRRIALLALLSAAALAAALLAPPIAQPLAYHAFADARTLIGVPNALDVLSNAGFLVAGLYGLVVLRAAGAAERAAYAVFFAGTVLTAFGSAWYHLAPDNARLVWDRLPMTLGFAGLASAVFGERLDARLGRVALPVLLVLGLASVLYWDATERAGSGNVVPYAIFQGWTMLAVGIALLAARDPRHSHGAAWWWVVALYAGAKIAEALDGAIFGLGQIVSGHTLKHLLAAAAVLAVAEVLRRRTPLASVPPVAATAGAR